MVIESFHASLMIKTDCRIHNARLFSQLFGKETESELQVKKLLRAVPNIVNYWLSVSKTAWIGAVNPHHVVSLWVIVSGCGLGIQLMMMWGLPDVRYTIPTHEQAQLLLMCSNVGYITTLVRPQGLADHTHIQSDVFGFSVALTHPRHPETSHFIIHCTKSSLCQQEIHCVLLSSRKP